MPGNEVYASASIGVSLFPQDADNAQALATNAEAAMFQSKKAGPGGYALHVENDADALSRLSLTTRLRKAVENQTWTLHYQPLVSLADGSMMGVEALIRWMEPNGGIVPPGEFIPLAEEMGLIEAIGDWVVEEIGRQAVEWRASGLELEIGFNLSPRQMFQTDLVDKIVSTAAGACGMDPTKSRRGDHRVHRDDRSRSARSGSSWTCTTGDCSSRSTTSAPGTRRWRA